MKASAASDILTRETEAEVMKNLMMRIKRSLAGLLAGIMLFSGSSAFAEGTDETVKIQESLVSREETEDASLQERLFQIAELMNKEEVRNLLKIDDVKSILNDVVLQVLRWMINNRPVTMKIFTELGIVEKDRQCIEKLWDSAERIENATREFRSSEDVARLKEEFNALTEDPVIQDSFRFVQTLFSRENIETVLQAIRNSMNTGEENGLGDGPLTQEARKEELERKSFVGFLLVLLLGIVEQSEQAQNLIPKLLNNRNLWQFFTHVAEAGSDINPVLLEEFNKLSDDSDVSDFIRRVVEGLQAASDKLLVKTNDTEGGTEPREETEGEAP